MKRAVRYKSSLQEIGSLERRHDGSKNHMFFWDTDTSKSSSAWSEGKWKAWRLMIFVKKNVPHSGVGHRISLDDYL